MTMVVPKAGRKITEAEFARLGRECKKALDGNLLVGSFAAEMVGQSYPFDKRKCDIVFEGFSDADLGRKFFKWMRDAEKARAERARA